jgi:ABC-type iron transport system FetAB permease component
LENFDAMLISVWQKLGLEREIAVGTVRSAMSAIVVFALASSAVITSII